MEKLSTQKYIRKYIVMTLLLTFLLIGGVSAEECIGEECDINMTITVEGCTSVPVYITYTAQKSLSPDLQLPTIRDNLVDTVGNFFALMPTVGIILAVIILVMGIVFLVTYILKLQPTNMFQG